MPKNHAKTFVRTSFFIALCRAIACAIRTAFFWGRSLANHNFGKELPDDTKQKISDNRKGKCVGSENPFYGKTHTETTLAAIREKCRARMAYMREMYYEYKTLGEPLKWNDFRKAFATSDLSVEAV
jgi:hypothetical protein